MSSKLKLENLYLQDPEQTKSSAYFCVSESKKSVESRLLNNQIPIILELDKKKGDYWIIEAENSSFYLFPKYNFRVNEFSYQTLEAIFNCIGYQPTQTNFWSLVSSATANPINDEKTEWIVTELGEITFSSEESQIATLALENQEEWTGLYTDNSEPQTITSNDNQVVSNQGIYLDLDLSDELNRLRSENIELQQKIASYESSFLNLKKIVDYMVATSEPSAIDSSNI